MSFSVVVKVFEEAWRILIPGGSLFILDVDGKAVSMLPDQLRGMLIRVPYSSVKHTVHDIW